MDRPLNKWHLSLYWQSPQSLQVFVGCSGPVLTSFELTEQPKVIIRRVEIMLVVWIRSNSTVIYHTNNSSSNQTDVFCPFFIWSAFVIDSLDMSCTSCIQEESSKTLWNPKI